MRQVSRLVFLSRPDIDDDHVASTRLLQKRFAPDRCQMLRVGLNLIQGMLQLQQILLGHLPQMDQRPDTSLPLSR